MASLGTILIIGYIVVVAALFTWLLRRKTKARSTYQRRAVILEKIREQAESESPIVGWMVRDDPVPVKSARRVRDLQ